MTKSQSSLNINLSTLSEAFYNNKTEKVIKWHLEHLDAWKQSKYAIKNIRTILTEENKFIIPLGTASFNPKQKLLKKWFNYIQSAAGWNTNNITIKQNHLKQQPMLLIQRCAYLYLEDYIKRMIPKEERKEYGKNKTLNKWKYPNIGTVENDWTRIIVNLTIDTILRLKYEISNCKLRTYIYSTELEDNFDILYKLVISYYKTLFVDVCASKNFIIENDKLWNPPLNSIPINLTKFNKKYDLLIQRDN